MSETMSITCKLANEKCFDVDCCLLSLSNANHHALRITTQAYGQR